MTKGADDQPRPLGEGGPPPSPRNAQMTLRPRTTSVPLAHSCRGASSGTPRMAIMEAPAIRMAPAESAPRTIQPRGVPASARLQPPAHVSQALFGGRPAAVIATSTAPPSPRASAAMAGRYFHPPAHSLDDRDELLQARSPPSPGNRPAWPVSCLPRTRQPPAWMGSRHGHGTA